MRQIEKLVGGDHRIDDCRSTEGKPSLIAFFDSSSVGATKLEPPQALKVFEWLGPTSADGRERTWRGLARGIGGSANQADYEIQERTDLCWRHVS